MRDGTMAQTKCPVRDVLGVRLPDSCAANTSSRVTWRSSVGTAVDATMSGTCRRRRSRRVAAVTASGPTNSHLAQNLSAPIGFW